jgi:hypothetical protein
MLGQCQGLLVLLILQKLSGGGYGMHAVLLRQPPPPPPPSPRCHKACPHVCTPIISINMKLAEHLGPLTCSSPQS